MKKQVNPIVIAIVAFVTVAGLGFFLYRSIQPAYYIPSPGAGGRPNTGVPAYAKAPGDASASAHATPVVPPAGSIQGNPGSIKH